MSRLTKAQARYLSEIVNHGIRRYNVQKRMIKRKKK